MMTESELEQLLDAGHETQSFEVKARMAWNHAKLAKDILALANVRDGGSIVIGIEDQTFARQGVDATTKKTYRIDVMRDQLAKYADPHVAFEVNFLHDSTGLEYAVIEVAPFRDIPVICRADSADTRAGTMYYRNSNRRIESGAISNSYDMRDIILTAVARTQLHLQGVGLQITTRTDKVKDYLDRELGGL
jgi:predicted HTH transcriptional regulator